MLKYDALVAKIGVDTDENDPSKVGKDAAAGDERDDERSERRPRGGDLLRPTVNHGSRLRGQPSVVDKDSRQIGAKGLFVERRKRQHFLF